MKITLITGGNTGLGFETARRLKAAGQKVYIGARNQAKAQEAAAELGVDYLLLDVTDEASILKAVTELQEKEGRLDVLVNNAGIPGKRLAVTEVSAAEAEKIFNTNVFGVIRMTQNFLPLLEKASQPVIVNVSSGLGSFSKVLDPTTVEAKVNPIIYAASKAAVSMLTVQYAKALPQFKVNAVDPGPTNTGENFTNGSQTITEATDVIVKMATIDKDGPTGTFTDRHGKISW